jgi:ubiquinone/menaquinone biosynthesis C-methylase UbiE
MGKIAKERDIEVIEGVAVSLPFPDANFVLMSPHICLLDNVDKAFKESNRVLKANGTIIIGFIDAESPLGMLYEEHKTESNFTNKQISTLREYFIF